jgi:hypothetical protein
VKTTLSLFFPFLLLAACLSPGCNSVEDKNRQADKTADMVLKLLAAGKTDSLYRNYTTDGFRDANSEETLRKLAKALSIYLGEPESHSLLKYDLKLTNAVASGQYVYKVRWAKADGMLMLKLFWQDGVCKIQSLDIQSDALSSGRKPASQSSQPTRPVNTGETIHI